MKKTLKSKAKSDLPRLERLALKRLFQVGLLTIFCLNLSLNLFAQNSTVSGSVSDASGELLVGVNVFVKGTTQGTITDVDGNYTISGIPEEATLVFSFVGMKTQEVVVGSQTNINIVLEADAIGLEELVVVGYTTRKKGEITGSISTVKSEELERMSNKDLAKSLSGKVPGLIVNDRGGYPGQGDLTLLIRGKSTLNNNSPLILIDGITAGDFSNLAPQDIESISVLKDGAAAIYGARAANGVILITTKKR